MPYIHIYTRVNEEDSREQGTEILDQKETISDLDYPVGTPLAEDDNWILRTSLKIVLGDEGEF